MQTVGRSASALAFLFGLVILEPLSFGQAADGNLVGTILDPTGAPIPSARIELAHVETGVKSTTTTGPVGEYRFGDVLVGSYNLTATAPGFVAGSLHDVRVDLNKTTTANLALEVGPTSTQLTVTEAPALLDTTTAQLNAIYERRLATDLPLASNAISGIYTLSLIGSGVASGGGVGVGYGPSVGGQRPHNNNFTIEGADNNRKDITGPVLFLPNDSVEEFSVLQNQFSAEFGHSSGGQFNAVVRSGSNEVHGSLYEYLQNRHLDANDQAAARQGIRTPPRYDQNRLGGAVGGPIRRNKWFFFGDFEYNPIGQAAVPSASIYSPTQAGYNLLNGMAGISKTNLGVLEKYAAPAAAAVRTTTVDGVAVPIGIDPVIYPSYSNNYNGVLSSDFNISVRDQLRGRYVSNSTTGIDTAAALPVFFYPLPTRAKLASLSEFHNFRPSLYNEVRLSFNRFNGDVKIPTVSYPGLDVFPNIAIRNDLNLNIGPDASGPQATIQTVYQVADNVTWNKGRHDFKFGFDGRDLMQASTFVQRERGDYEWTSLQGFLNDTVPDYLAQRNVDGKPYSGNDTAYYLFANDNWRYNQHLAINLGLRYEFNGVSQSMREFGLNSIANVPGVLTFQAPQAGKKNFAPRVGLAYSPGTSGTTSIRSGFGMAYDQIFDNVGLNARPPQATSTVDVTGTAGTGFLASGGILPSVLPATLSPAQARAATSSYLPANQQLGYALTWNVGIQHSFAKDYTAEIRYVGTKGVHLLVQEQINRNSLVTPSNYLPTYLQAPSQATLNSLTLTTAQLAAERVPANPAWDPIGAYGFTSAITAYVPRGNSEYHGLATEIKKRYSGNLLLDAAYTFSHLIDDSTSELNSTVASPRRAQDFNNLSSEKANSALDHRHRIALTAVYDTPWFSKSRNALVRNSIGNWEASGTYMYETGEWATPQSGVDSNQNGDSAADRVILNPNGVLGTSSGVTALKNASGATVAYLAANPTAQFIQAQAGALANSGRNILATPPIENIDFMIAKNLTFKERYRLQLRADMYNALNHPQYTLGPIDNVRPRNTAGAANWFIPGNPLFGDWNQVFSSNPRAMQVSAKLTF